MNQEKNDVTVRIMNRDFRVKCPISKVSDLKKAATYLENKIKEIKEDYEKILNKDSLLAIAALNTIAEMFQLKNQHHTYIASSDRDLREIGDLLDQFLDGRGQ